MGKKRKTIVIAGVVGATGLVGVTLLGPAVAATATGQDPAAATTRRVDGLKNALSGLVKDGTLTQEQADKVAGTLAEKMPERGFGGPGRGFGFGGNVEDVATALGITNEELRTALASGKTIREVAASKNVSATDLIAKLVAAAKVRLAKQVTDGKLTQAQSDSIATGLTERMTTLLDRKGGERMFPGGRGPEGRGPDGRGPEARGFGDHFGHGRPGTREVPVPQGSPATPTPPSSSNVPSPSSATTPASA